MRTAFVSLSRLLALVLALTVLAPGFGWQSAGGMVGEALAAVDAGSDPHHGEADEDCTGCDESHDDCDERIHHCCPGHILGHLPGQAAATILLPLPDRGKLAVDRDPQRFSSRVPEGLERPPRSVTA